MNAHSPWTILGKTYFFKGRGYWQFDDYRMRVAHEHQKKSSVKWMGCSETLEIEPDRREYLKNSKRDEETEDVNNDEEDMYFEFELSTKASSSNHLSCSIATVLLIFSINWRLT